MPLCAPQGAVAPTLGPPPRTGPHRCWVSPPPRVTRSGLQARSTKTMIFDESKLFAFYPFVCVVSIPNRTHPAPNGYSAVGATHCPVGAWHVPFWGEAILHLPQGAPPPNRLLLGVCSHVAVPLPTTPMHGPYPISLAAALDRRPRPCAACAAYAWVCVTVLRVMRAPCLCQGAGGPALLSLCFSWVNDASGYQFPTRRCFQR